MASSPLQRRGGSRNFSRGEQDEHKYETATWIDSMMGATTNNNREDTKTFLFGRFSLFADLKIENIHE